MSHVEPERGGNRDQIGLGSVPDTSLVTQLRRRLEIKERIIRNLHKSLERKRATITTLRLELGRKRKR